MVKLIDWGLSLASDRGRSTTEPGVVKGKMSYLSPEIAQDGRPTIYSDQFAVGSVLWEALVGKKLFDGSTDLEVFGKLREGQIAPLRPLRRDVPKPLIQCVQRALHVDPEKRFPSAREMGKQLAHSLKAASVPKDLHALLGKTVCEARASLDMGSRTGEPSTATPIADPQIETVDLAGLQGNRRGRRSTDPVVAPSSGRDVKRGLLHRFPFFGRRRG